MGSVGGVFGSTQSGRKEAKPISKCVPWANWADPEKNMTSPKSSKFSPLRAVLVGLGFWLSLEKKQPLGVKMPLRHLVGWMQ